MTEPPSPKKLPTFCSAEKLQELYSQHAFQQKLLRCERHSDTVSQGDYWLDARETKELIRFTDPETKDEVLLAAEYSYPREPDKGKKLIVLRLRTVTDDIYELRRI